MAPGENEFDIPASNAFQSARSGKQFTKYMFSISERDGSSVEKSVEVEQCLGWTLTCRAAALTCSRLCKAGP